MEAIGYVRCSTQEQADSALGIAAQMERTNAYAAMKGLDLLDVIVDAGVSAGKPLASRGGGKALLKAIRGRKVKAVIMLKLDRGFRNAVDCLSVIDKWERSGVSLHVIDLNGSSVDSRSATGRFALTILAAAAEMESNQVRERTRMALAIKRARGERISRFVPFGFSLGDDGVHLVPIESELAVVEQMRLWREAGESYAKIARRLRRADIATKAGGTWAAETVRQICRREAIGEASSH